jgi:hypothetical protein
MSQEVPTVADVSRQSDEGGEVETTETATELAGVSDSPPVDAGPGASESGFAVRFGSGFAVGMLVGGIVGVLLNSLPLAMFGGFILGTVVGTVLAARG